jgi:hypothetical protein
MRYPLQKKQRKGEKPDPFPKNRERKEQGKRNSVAIPSSGLYLSSPCCQSRPTILTIGSEVICLLEAVEALEGEPERSPASAVLVDDHSAA